MGKDGVTADTDVVLEVTYDVVTLDDKLTLGYALESNTVEMSMPIGSLVESKAYNVTLTVSLESVQLDATVTDWDDVTEEEVNAYDPDEVVVADGADAINSAISTAIAAGVNVVTIDATAITEAASIELKVASAAEVTINFDSTYNSTITLVGDTTDVFTGTVNVNAAAVSTVGTTDFGGKIVLNGASAA